MGAHPNRLAGRSMFDFVHWSNVRQLQDALVTGMSSQQRMACRIRGKVLEHMHSDVTMYPVCVDGEHMTLLFAWCSPDQTSISALTLQNSPPAMPRLPRPPTSKGWCIHTPDGCITDVYSSANTDELFGYEFSRLQGTCLYALIHPDDIGHVSTLHTGSVHTRRVSLMYQRIQNRDGTWAMAKTLFIPCINKKTEAVEFCLSAISLECGDSEPMPSRAAECRLLEDKSPLVFGDVTQIRSLCEKAARRAGEDELSDDPWLTEAEASAIHHAIKCIDEATAQSDALFGDPAPGNSQSRASDSHEAPTPQGHVGLLNSSPTSDSLPQPRDLMPKKGDSPNRGDVARDCMETGKDSLGAKNMSNPPTKEKEKRSSEEYGDTDMVASKSRNRRQKKKRENTNEGKGGLRNIVPRERLLLSINVNSDTNIFAGLCAEAANRNDLFDTALSSYSVQITPRNQPFFPNYNNLNDGYLQPVALQPTQSLPSQSDSRNDLSWNASISTSSQNISFSSQSNADLTQLLRQHITATNELVAANARSNLGLSSHPMSENPGLGLRQPICSMSAPTGRFLLAHSLAAAPARPIPGSVSDRVISPQDRHSAGDGTVLDCTLAKSGMSF